ncbi:hypothetical protein JMF97_06405 [Micromonospora fiedleri]|uniref:Uncharacterized protein n=1 Tax=Micromonospora fiedleri TaxID=1157498 RepID=A0ABS1UHU7_9ACTN|nr:MULTISPECIES: hypothetical protein [Micromonospora]MBL6275789.1 hypothetical protein [Micromonospora fiedleri]WSK41900.1 hypothetical protein OG712_25970 [Micromonospora maris]
MRVDGARPIAVRVDSAGPVAVGVDGVWLALVRGGGDRAGTPGGRGDGLLGHHRQVTAGRVVVGGGRDGPVGVGPLRGRPVQVALRPGTVGGGGSPVLASGAVAGFGYDRTLVLPVVPTGARAQRSRLGPGEAAARRFGVPLGVSDSRLGAGALRRPVGAGLLVVRATGRLVVDVTVGVRGSIGVTDGELLPVAVHPRPVVVAGLTGMAAPLVAGTPRVVSGGAAVGVLDGPVRGGAVGFPARLGRPTALRSPGRRPGRATPVRIAVGRLGSAWALGVPVGIAVAPLRIVVRIAVGLTPVGPTWIRLTPVGPTWVGLAAVGLTSVGLTARVPVGGASLGRLEAATVPAIPVRRVPVDVGLGVPLTGALVSLGRRAGDTGRLWTGVGPGDTVASAYRLDGR